MRPGPSWTFSGFQVVEHPGARVLARPEAVPWVRFVLESGRSLHSAAGRDRGAFRLEGRYPVFVIAAKSPGEEEKATHRWAVRHYARGGRFVPILLGDRYLRFERIRPYHEIEASETARERGISTPRVVAAALYPSRLFYRADLVTQFVPDASDLVESFFDTSRKGVGGAAERLDSLRVTGDLIRRMAGAGLRHRDLHARNILLEWRGSVPRPHLLDLDRCEIEPSGAPVSPTSMHQRLRRSLRKWERRTGIRISEREWAALDQAVRG